ncbi:MAG: gluconate 2-dehydrogenase subunit 3 family protein [Sphingobacteriales bacterium]|nr:MAG: gluconate 2-dehydrogenase subunit 3 family protein [Sphingobacteriales bacterium]
MQAKWNRRKLLKRGLLLGTGGAIAFGGFKWYDWHKTPDFTFLENNKELLNALSETIIPATDTPGAKEANIAEYIIIMIKDCTTKVSQNRFIDGVKAINKKAISKYDKPYARCTVQQQTILLQQYASSKPFTGKLGKLEEKYLDKSFFYTLKELTVKGYCTSKTGATKGLAYQPVPGQYIGCQPVTPSQKAWATK